MKYNGKLLYLSVGSTPVQINDERNTTFTITSEHTVGAGSARCHTNHGGQKSWEIQTQTLIDYSDFLTLFNSMINGTLITLRFQTPATNNRNRYFRGDAVITRLSFAGQGKGLVSLNISATGAGKPSTYIR